MIATFQASFETRLSKDEHIERVKFDTILNPILQLQWCNELEVPEVKRPLTLLGAPVSSTPVTAQSSDTATS